MSDPERLADGHADPVVRSLFAAAAEEEPSAALVARVLAPLGAGAASSAASGSLQPVASAEGGVGSGAAAAGTKGALTASSLPTGLAGSSLLVAALKWAGIASIGTAASVGTVSVISSSRVGPADSAKTAMDKASTRSVGAPARAATFAFAATPGTAHHATSPRTPAVTAPVARALTTTSAPERPALSVPNDPRLGLGEQAALIDEARRAVANGDASAALRLLGTYRQRYPRPLLAPEALYLEMRAHELRGNQTLARKLAERLLAAYPNGVHAARARALLKAREP